MSCPRCAKPVPPGAAFCPSCGLPVRAPAPTGPVPRPADARAAPQAMARPTAAPVGAGMGGSVAADFDAQRKRNRIAVAVGCALALVAGLFGLKAALRLGASAPKPALQVASQAPPPALALPARATPAPLTKEARRPVMPADVEAWLKHLEKCEREKLVIEGDQNANMQVFAQKLSVLGAGIGYENPYAQENGGDSDPSPQDYTRNKFEDLRPRWEQLLTFFNSVPPPEECKPLAADFNHALGEIPGMVGDVNDVLNLVTTNPDEALQKANKMKGKSYDEIDRYFARADQKLTAICAKYEKNKWFNIKTDVGTGSLSLPGGAGGSPVGGMTLGQ